MRRAAAKRPYASLAVGDTAALRHRIAARDVAAFAALSGDRNPLHTEQEYASRTIFKKRVVHGMYLGALISRLVGMELPGAYALLMKTSMEFKKPVFAGEEIELKAMLMHKSDPGRLVELAIEIRRSGDIVALGSAHVRVLQ